MFTKILIANRGEIACRVIATAKKMGIAYVVVYTEADTHSKHVKSAEESFLISSYLNQQEIIAIAKKSGAEAIHPGYGFLSENSAFCELCEKDNIKFIGPNADNINIMGSKSDAKKYVEKAGVKTIPGYHGDKQDNIYLKKQILEIGLPVLIKAAYGGGGKGMRLIESTDQIEESILSAKREAEKSFGNNKLLIEKYFPLSRHIEIQLFSDNNNHCVHLFDRDCSIQRRHQKVVEEAPAQNIPENIKKNMYADSIKIAKSINYTNAGTIEYLVDDKNNYYFMEMNTRLQVEHPVTEMITGIDCVEWQLRIAAGEPLPLEQNQIKINGHSIEVRVYSEDPSNNFLPSIGEIIYLDEPSNMPHTRIDSSVETNNTITINFDPMLAKLITHGESRTQAMENMAGLLENYCLFGVNTNLNFLYKIINNTNYKTKIIHTNFIEKNHDSLVNIKINKTDYQYALSYLVTHNQTDTNSPWDSHTGWRANLPRLAKQQFIENTNIIDCVMDYSQLEHTSDMFIIKHNNSIYLKKSGITKTLVLYNPLTSHSSHQEQGGHLISPMPGAVVAVYKKPGEKVSSGEPLIAIEAMKMEHTLYAPEDGIIEHIFYNIGEQVEEGVELINLATMDEM